MAVIATVPTIKIIWDWIKEGKGKGSKGGGEQEGEEKGKGTEGGGDKDAGLCLAATDAYVGDAYLTKCGADGTAWIAVPHGDGYYLVSRWWYDNGVPDEVLTADPVSNDAAVFVAPVGGPGSPYWQIWSS
jgi:hypothetical protein